ncbi:hypothetical protein FRB96_006945 [Tulasnella sp. 330]|nr:hypothetical protein FRB96_006945 [Tulasnella sp. 330]KAG8876553.1 hypothetical protein FRB97_004106 [Tulasnella sp. 331]KAG8889833.1 hypothetical protein FRB98_002482 [Tulasnella sp. 332]
MILANSESDKITTEFTASESNPTETKYDPPEAGPSTPVAQAPPAYDDAAYCDDANDYTPPPNPSSTARVNHICIKEQSENIKGEWTIDPNVRVPSSLVSRIQPGEAGQNLVLESKNGSVAGKVRLISDKPSKSIIHASSHSGSVTMKFPQRFNQRFYLKAHSQNGNVTARIPPDFQGPVTFMTKNGSLRFSDRVQQSLVHLSRSDKAGKAFIGTQGSLGFANVGEAGGESWHGDELVLSSENGTIRVEYVDEPTEFQKIREDFTGDGPIRGVVKYAFRKISGRSMGSKMRQS